MNSRDFCSADILEILFFTRYAFKNSSTYWKHLSSILSSFISHLLRIKWEEEEAGHLDSLSSFAINSLCGLVQVCSFLWAFVPTFLTQRDWTSWSGTLAQSFWDSMML